jgi:hypothetical protein
MGIYLGNVGSVEIRRKSTEGAKQSLVNPSDVNTGKDRFSFDFEEGFLITGDLIEIKTTDGTNLDFVAASGWAASAVQSSGNWYASIDELGGIRLYNSFDDSLEGGSTGLVQLATITRDIPISVSIRDRDIRLLASIADYELNTNRETVDITTLSDQHRQQYSDLISGSGTLTAHWDYVNAAENEPVHYLMQLVLRTEIGSTFGAKFYVKAPGTQSSGGNFTTTQLDDSLWWEFDALVTNSAVSFTPSEIVVSRIDFVTTGPIRLRASTRPTRYLVQESGDKLKLEQDPQSFLALDDPT